MKQNYRVVVSLFLVLGMSILMGQSSPGYAKSNGTFIADYPAVENPGHESLRSIMKEGKLFDQTVPLIELIGLSVVASLVSGALCALIAKKTSRGPGLALALALLGTGIAVQASAWKFEPVWYHLTFLVLLVPITLLGASFVKIPVKTAT